MGQQPCSGCQPAADAATAHPPVLCQFLHSAHLQIAVLLPWGTPACNPLGHHHGSWKERLKPPSYNGFYETVLRKPAKLDNFPLLLSAVLRELVFQQLHQDTWWLLSMWASNSFSVPVFCDPGPDQLAETEQLSLNWTLVPCGRGARQLTKDPSFTGKGWLYRCSTFARAAIQVLMCPLKESQNHYHFWWRLSTQGKRSSWEKPVHSDSWLVQACAGEESTYSYIELHIHEVL